MANGDVTLLSPRNGPLSPRGAPTYTVASPTLFEELVTPIGVSGGTASFYRLIYTGGERSRDYFIGKDLSHAKDEVDFYEDAMRAIREDRHGPMSDLLKFVFEYAGVLTVPASDHLDGKPVSLLTLRNLYDGCEKLRMLDMKIGQRTAAANWKGKPWYRTAVQNARDFLTNSIEEGFRLEGFDGEPKALESMDLICSGPRAGTGKRYRFRTMLQQMRCTEMLMHFLDVNDMPDIPEDQSLADVRSPIEVAEVVLRASVRRLVDLSLACRSSPTPQKWIGSSVALAFDCGRLPARSLTDAEVCKSEHIRVHIFDWGRSELNTVDKNDRLTAAQQADYKKFWGYYIDGVDRLAWEAARAYKHRFGNPIGWTEALLTLVDFDKSGYDQVFGYVKISPLHKTDTQVAEIIDSQGVAVTSATGEPATLTYAIEYREYPEGSYLKGAWRIRVINAFNLPRMSFKGPPDVYAELIAWSDPHKGGERYGFRQITSVRHSDLHPQWNETLELPIAAHPNVLSEVLMKASPCFDHITNMMPREEVAVQSFHVAQQLPGSFSTEIESSAASSSYRFSIISFGEGLDDESCITEWRNRLERIISERMPEEAQSPSYQIPARRPIMGKAEVLRLIYQPSFWVRGFAIFGVIWSSIMCVMVLIMCMKPNGYLVYPWKEIAIAHAFLQLPLGPIALLFETRPRRVTSIGCDRFMDRVMEITSIHRVNRRGWLYIVQGSCWIADSFLWGVDKGFSEWPLSVGICLCLVGLMLICTHYGAMRQQVVRKVSRAVLSEGSYDWLDEQSASRANSVVSSSAGTLANLPSLRYVPSYRSSIPTSAGGSGGSGGSCGTDIEMVARGSSSTNLEPPKSSKS